MIVVCLRRLQSQRSFSEYSSSDEPLLRSTVKVMENVKVSSNMSVSRSQRVTKSRSECQGQAAAGAKSGTGRRRPSANQRRWQLRHDKQTVYGDRDWRQFRVT